MAAAYVTLDLRLEVIAGSGLSCAIPVQKSDKRNKHRMPTAGSLLQKCTAEPIFELDALLIFAVSH